MVVGDVEAVESLQVRDPEKVAYITQTTLSVDDTREVIAALRRRFPKVVGPDVKDICYATQNRQAAVRMAAAIADVVLVVGARNSSNSNRLCEVANAAGRAEPSGRRSIKARSGLAGGQEERVHYGRRVHSGGVGLGGHRETAGVRTAGGLNHGRDC